MSYRPLVAISMLIVTTLSCRSRPNPEAAALTASDPPAKWLKVVAIKNTVDEWHLSFFSCTGVSSNLSCQQVGAGQYNKKDLKGLEDRIVSVTGKSKTRLLRDGAVVLAACIEELRNQGVPLKSVKDIGDVAADFEASLRLAGDGNEVGYRFAGGKLEIFAPTDSKAVKNASARGSKLVAVGGSIAVKTKDGTTLDFGSGEKLITALKAVLADIDKEKLERQEQLQKIAGQLNSEEVDRYMRGYCKAWRATHNGRPGAACYDVPSD